ncbi:MAG: P-loop NTPase [Candidatus Omnitrophica bacterium]|nr:P-loop NTPase [Candidatus Omnitrophota bacterium]
MDPRINVINKRLAGVKKIIAVSGGKGGIGKSTFSAVLALTLSKAGYKVGLMDLDFWGPSGHVLLGAQGISPVEDKGIVPPQINGVKFMSIIYYTEDKTLALRRAGFDQAAIELLAVTQWGALDYLIMDMPPGVGDVTLDVIRFMEKVKFCIITTHSKVVMETVKKTLNILKQLKIPIFGVVQNMKEKNLSVEMQIKRLHVPFWGKIDFDAELEGAIGDPKKLLETKFSKNVNKLIHKDSRNHI